MEAKLRSINRIQLVDAEEALERLFDGIDSPEVSTALSGWLEFGRKDQRGKLDALTPAQLAEFMDKLPELALALYCYQKDLKKGGDK